MISIYPHLTREKNDKTKYYVEMKEEKLLYIPLTLKRQKMNTMNNFMLINFITQMNKFLERQSSKTHTRRNKQYEQDFIDLNN